MNDNARRWLDDLKSGKWKKGSGCLRRSDNFCCAGVACDTYHAVTGVGEWQLIDDGDDDVYQFVISGEEPEASIFPQAVADWLGLRTKMGEWGCPQKYRSLLILNDEDENWDRVIDVIESEVEGLFS